MSNSSPILLWLRRGDLRLADNPALASACETGCPVIPVFLKDEMADRLGAAARWRLEASLRALAKDLERRESRLILRSGAAGKALEQLAGETGAAAVYWMRRYDPAAIECDKGVKSRLKAKGLSAKSFAGNMLFEPWTVESSTGAPYRVFTPMWKALRDREVPAPVDVPARISAPETWPSSEALGDWQLGAAMNRGANVLARHAVAGEAAATERLADFLDSRLAGYAAGRDRLDRDGTSGLSPFLAAGEISARQVWHAISRARAEGLGGAEAFLRQLMWRDFAGHILFHCPEMTDRCWRPDWEAFPWNPEEDRPEVDAWKRGCTGVDLVDAAMREMQVTGVMHNRARMLVASYLTKHLLADWRIGMRWFEDHLIDWDAGNNALGWQWVAGCGPDAAPFFRIFNPDLQAEKFDPKGHYRRRWLAEGQSQPPVTALDFFDAAPRAWGLAPGDARPDPVVALDRGRSAAQAAWARFRDERGCGS
ncbi:deoxyribodipyrimidine photo-lyase [Tropicimonas sp. IMCC6043]|uniref:cryptochrome/photolyase family protein n=1 Tax=Tropicimonas sp. IMCC6043 TaxID=2510645 RepID=UPI00101DA0FE|nr:deoxyribodipyrimidine photo-lyase [Tropicimonas sp. IMCC6043]RYH10274.1 deoxyribodipyrimidine photo-lyase [Tropicimonas sp. IMCC6043]